MKVVVVAVGVFVLLIVVGAIIGPKKATKTAQPSGANLPTAYLSVVRAAATGSLVKNAPDSNLVALGQGVCTKLADRSPGQVEAGMLSSGQGATFPQADAATVVIAAGSHLCPAHASTVGSWNKQPDFGPAPHAATTTVAPVTLTPTTAPVTTQPPTPVTTVAPVTTPPPTSPPAPGVTITSVTSPVSPGQYATLTAQASPGDNCSLSVTYASGTVSQASGLGPATADGAGKLRWTWKVGARTGAGTATADVTCPDGTASTTFEVS